MTPIQARRPRLGMTLLALALGALALLAMPALANAKDRNGDRIPDRWEKRHRLSLKVNQARRDQDHDQLRNRAEFLAGDNPRDRDSDDDGVSDGDEQAGTIASFDAETGRLVIDLFGDDTIAGFVTEETEIECEDHSSASSSSEDEESEAGEEHGDDGESEDGDVDGGEHGEGEGDDDSGSDGDDSGHEHDGEDHEGDDHESEDHGDRACTTAELVPGAAVEEAELKIENGRATFEEVELSGKEVG